MMQKSSTRTLYNYWNALRGARSAPERRDIDPARIKSALASTFILERDTHEEFSFRLAGSHICSAYARELKGRSFSRLWHVRDRDAMGTLIRAVTEDHAVALVTFEGTTPIHTKASFETILLPVRHNGVTDTRILGAITALDTPYWFGIQPIMEQRITGLRLIWPDEASPTDIMRNIASDVANEIDFHEGARAIREAHGIVPPPLTATVFGRTARRYAHLAVIDGGRPQ
jgi:hypothetical protein